VGKGTVFAFNRVIVMYAPLNFNSAPCSQPQKVGSQAPTPTNKRGEEEGVEEIERERKADKRQGREISA